MRNIEVNIVASLKSDDPRPAQLSVRDTIEVGSLDCGSNVVYRLHGSQVAVYSRVNKTLSLGVPGGKWSTATTKSRINAIARSFDVPQIVQKDFSWTWTDGQPYDGVRLFPLNR